MDYSKGGRQGTASYRSLNGLLQAPHFLCSYFLCEVMIDRMTELFNEVWEEERVPRKWNECRVTLIHKGRYKSKNELKNYRVRFVLLWISTKTNHNI